MHPWKPCDFTHLYPLSETQQLALKELNHKYADQLTARLADLWHRDIRISFQELNQQMLSYYLLTLPNPSFMGTFLLSAENEAILEINPSLIYAAIDFMLGSKSKYTPQIRSLKELEMGLIRKLFNLFLQELSLVWRPLIKTDFHLRTLLANPVNFPRQEEFWMTSLFKLSIGDLSGLFSIALPVSALESIKPLLGSAHSDTKKESSHNHAGSTKKMKNVEVNLKAVLGKMTMSYQELYDLKPGDVLDLGCPVNTPIHLTINEDHVFSAQPGLKGSFKAVKLITERSRK